MSGKTLPLVGEDWFSEHDERYCECNEVALGFLNISDDVYFTDENGVRDSRRRSRQELGEAMMYLGRSGFAEELLGLGTKNSDTLNENVAARYHSAYVEVFGPYIWWGQAGVRPDSFEADVYDSIPEKYLEWRKKYGQLPAWADK